MKILGLDVGVTSLGWAIVDVESNEIIKCGVRLFDGVAQNRLGELESKNWANAKSSRKRFKRKKERLKNIIREFQKINFLESSFNKEDFFLNFHKNIYELRVKALDSKLSKEEIFACIYHLAKHRGYRSGSVGEGDKGKEDGTKENIKETRKNLSNFQTFGEFLFKRTENQNPNYVQYRNRSGNVVAMADKNMVEDEVKKILQKQKEFYGELDSISNNIIEIINLKAKPNGKSQMEAMLGKCQFEENEYRTSSDTLTAILSKILQKINNIKIIKNDEISDLITPESEESKKIIENLIKQFFDKYALSYADIREIASLDINTYFKDINYQDIITKKISKEFNGIKTNVFKNFQYFKRSLYEQVENNIDESSFKEIVQNNLCDGKSLDEIPNLEKIYKNFKKLSKKQVEKETKLFEDKHLKVIAEAFKLRFQDVESIKNNREMVDSIILAYFYKDEDKVNELLEKYEISQEVRESLGELNIKGTSNLSLVALKKIEPFLLQGFKYTQSCQKAGYNKEQSQRRFKKLPLMREAMKMGLVGINNPNVRKINNQVVKVINELISRKIYFDRIHIELARDIPKTKNERKKESESNKAVEEIKANAKEALRDILGDKPNDKDILRARLFLEQNEICPYCAEKLKRSELKNYEIDHIKPLSISFDNTYSNKVLSHKKCNEEKGKRFPLEWLKGEKATAYINRINSVFKTLGKRKRDNLLKKEKDEDSENPRILTETRYAARFLKNYIEKHLDFDSFSLESNLPKSTSSAKSQRVQARNGSVTNILRNFWHIGKQDSNNESQKEERYKKDRTIHTHHAEDAIILAFATQSLVQKIHTDARKISNKNDKSNNVAIDFSTGEVTETPKDISAKNQALIKKLNFELHNSAPISPDKVNEAIAKVFPSRMVTRLKKYGEVHKETIYSIRDKSKSYQRLLADDIKNAIANKDIENLVKIKKQTLSNKSEAKKHIENMVDKDNRNKKMYECIKKYLDSNDEECIYKGIKIKSFKYEEQFSVNTIPVRGGIADKASQQKYLVYKKDGYFYIGVVYCGDNIKDDRNARVQISDKDKDYEYRDYSDNGYSYVMTLHKNDLLYYEQENKSAKDGVEKRIYYIDYFNPSKVSSQMLFKDPVIYSQKDKNSDKEKEYTPSKKFGKLSLKNIKKLERLEVDMLGNVYRIQDGKKIDFTKEALEIVKNQHKDK